MKTKYLFAVLAIFTLVACGGGDGGGGEVPIDKGEVNHPPKGPPR